MAKKSDIKDMVTKADIAELKAESKANLKAAALGGVSQSFVAGAGMFEV